jgi:hypothetical protein
MGATPYIIAVIASVPVNPPNTKRFTCGRMPSSRSSSVTWLVAALAGFRDLGDRDGVAVERTGDCHGLSGLLESCSYRSSIKSK